MSILIVFPILQMIHIAFKTIGEYEINEWFMLNLKPLKRVINIDSINAIQEIIEKHDSNLVDCWEK